MDLGVIALNISSEFFWSQALKPHHQMFECHTQGIFEGPPEEKSAYSIDPVN